VSYPQPTIRIIHFETYPTYLGQVFLDVLKPYNQNFFVAPVPVILRCKGKGQEYRLCTRSGYVMLCCGIWYIYIYICILCHVILRLLCFLLFSIPKIDAVVWCLVVTNLEQDVGPFLQGPCWKCSDVDRRFGFFYMGPGMPIFSREVCFKSTFWLFNIAMENGPFIDGLPNFKMVIVHGYVK